jgi:hypothetical protein
MPNDPVALSLRQRLHALYDVLGDRVRMTTIGLQINVF